MQQANALVIKHDPNPPHRLLKPELPPETYVGMRLGTLIGEIFYNLRTAMDYLVFELAKLDSGAEQSRTQFPIESDPNIFRGNAPRLLVGLNAAHVTAIERLQPYNGCKWTARLRDCSNPDKHRHFVRVGHDGGFHIHSSLERNISGCLGFERYADHPVAGHPPVKVKVYITGEVAFEDGAPVIQTIQEVQTEIANTLAHFKQDF